MSDTAAFIVPFALLFVATILGIFRFRKNGVSWPVAIGGTLAGAALGLIIIGGMFYFAGMIVL